MRGEAAVKLLVGQLVGRGVQEAVEFVPADANVKRIIRFAYGVGGLLATVYARLPADVEDMLAISSSKVLADEIVDFVLQHFAKPQTARAPASLVVPVQPVQAQPKASLW